MLVIGLISGTSMDAIDAALVELDHVGHTLRMRMRAFAMFPYDPALRTQVVELLPPQQGSTAAVCAINVLLGEAFASAALRLVQQAGIPIDQVDLIASHGQTVYHQVAPMQVRSTLQLGAPAVIAERCGCTVAADFRRATSPRAVRARRWSPTSTCCSSATSSAAAPYRTSAASAT
jgi:anhydro-N-acetylmuramic acid kinase